MAVFVGIAFKHASGMSNCARPSATSRRSWATFGILEDAARGHRARRDVAAAERGARRPWRAGRSGSSRCRRRAGSGARPRPPSCTRRGRCASWRSCMNFWSALRLLPVSGFVRSTGVWSGVTPFDVRSNAAPLVPATAAKACRRVLVGELVLVLDVRGERVLQVQRLVAPNAAIRSSRMPPVFGRRRGRSARARRGARPRASTAPGCAPRGARRRSP